jgi:hypothetical protein
MRMGRVLAIVAGRWLDRRWLLHLRPSVRAAPVGDEELGIEHEWMHRGPAGGSVSRTATEYGREHGITVIDGGCPCMFGPTVDFGHKAMRAVFTLTGNVPKQV